MGNFGQYLRERRKEKGITKEYVALHTPLNENILTALENEDYNFFKSSFYFSNFLNSYLDFLGIDRDRFYSEHSPDMSVLKKSGDVQIVRSLTGLRYSRFRNRAMIIKGIIAGIILALIIYLLFVNKGLAFSLFEEETTPIPETGGPVAGLPESEPDFSPVNLILRFTDSCWIKAFRGREVIFEKVYITGEEIRINGYDIRLVIGNPSVVDLTVNNVKTDKYRNMGRSALIRINPMTADSII